MHTWRNLVRVLASSIAFTSPDCSFVVDGTSAAADDGEATFWYQNDSKGVFAIGSRGGAAGNDLTVYDVSGCTGWFSDGDPISMDYIFNLSAGLTITSP
jgi:hypothetical protein